MASYITYEMEKQFYKKFKQNPPEDKFTRYYTELKHMESLIKFAEKEDPKKVSKYVRRKEKTIRKLEAMGYHFS